MAETSSQLFSTSLKILSWNIQGLQTKLSSTKTTHGRSKLDIPFIKNIIKDFDIICLQETWLKKDDLVFLDIRQKVRLENPNQTEVGEELQYS